MIDFTKKQKKLAQRDFRKQLKYKKLIALTVQQIVKRNTLRLNDDDIKEISSKYAKRTDLLIISRIKQTLHNELAKNDINTALIEFYSSAGLDKQEAVNLLNLAKETAKEKKDVTNLLKIVEKYENAANLTHKNAVNVSQTQIIDYSKIGKDGQPLQKVIKTVETTINDAQNCDISNDQGSVDSKPRPENS